MITPVKPFFFGTVLITGIFPAGKSSQETEARLNPWEAAALRALSFWTHLWRPRVCCFCLHLWRPWPRRDCKRNARYTPGDTGTSQGHAVFNSFTERQLLERRPWRTVAGWCSQREMHRPPITSFLNSHNYSISLFQNNDWIYYKRVWGGYSVT